MAHGTQLAKPQSRKKHRRFFPERVAYLAIFAPAWPVRFSGSVHVLRPAPDLSVLYIPMIRFLTPPNLPAFLTGIER